MLCRNCIPPKIVSPGMIMLQSCARPSMLDGFLESDDTMSIMPFTSASAHICCRFCHDIPRMMPSALCPHGANHIVILVLISIGVLNGGLRMSNSSSPGHSGLIDRSSCIIINMLQESTTPIGITVFWHRSELPLDSCFQMVLYSHCIMRCWLPLPWCVKPRHAPAPS